MVPYECSFFTYKPQKERFCPQINTLGGTEALAAEPASLLLSEQLSAIDFSSLFQSEEEGIKSDIRHLVEDSCKQIMS